MPNKRKCEEAGVAMGWGEVKWGEWGRVGWGLMELGGAAFGVGRGGVGWGFSVNERSEARPIERAKRAIWLVHLY